MTQLSKHSDGGVYCLVLCGSGGKRNVSPVASNIFFCCVLHALTALGASDIFTQDIEDRPDEWRQAANDDGQVRKISL